MRTKLLQHFILILLGISFSWSKDLSGPDTSRYHSYEEARQTFEKYETQYPGLAKLHSIGKSVEQRDLLVLEISRNVGEPRSVGKPMFKWVANMHGKTRRRGRFVGRRRDWKKAYVRLAEGEKPIEFFEGV